MSQIYMGYAMGDMITFLSNCIHTYVCLPIFMRPFSLTSINFFNESNIFAKNTHF